MLHFNELYITEDGKHLVIDVEIDANSAYNGCFIDKISVNLPSGCDDTTQLTEPIVLYDGTVVVGDLTNSDSITEDDIKMWRDLLNLCSRSLKQDADGKYYYIDSDNVTSEPINVYVNSNIPQLIEYISSHYGYISLRTSSGNALYAEKLLLYILDIIGNNTIPGVSMEFARTNGITPTINNFITYLEEVEKGISDTGILYTIKKETHIHLCKDHTDLVPLIDAKEKDLSKYIFVIDATANCSNANIEEIESLDCDSDIKSITGIAYNGKPLYGMAINYASLFGDTCDSKDASSFVDFLMRYYGFLFAIKCGDICTALYYWNNYLNGTSVSKKHSSSFRPCGCHGTYR